LLLLFVYIHQSEAIRCFCTPEQPRCKSGIKYCYYSNACFMADCGGVIEKGCRDDFQLTFDGCKAIDQKGLKCNFCLCGGDNCNRVDATTRPTTKQPTTECLTTKQPTATERPTTKHSTIKQSTTEQSTTEPPTTKPPTTKQSTAKQMTTKLLTTPAAEQPTTGQPATEQSTTDRPTTKNSNKAITCYCTPNMKGCNNGVMSCSSNACGRVICDGVNWIGCRDNFPLHWEGCKNMTIHGHNCNVCLCGSDKCNKY